ncbi:hypothetical protein ONZ43_g4532 [Nemania bipapillata]|uniref:Uncharacterized protein n=1 Tax=Nemania bipapillata TaxID=110536 RepID=A0ACC2ILE8_9PEZI|nr:hypothetical protein ONZ43_g4532 [Nemania bipapillata]
MPGTWPSWADEPDTAAPLNIERDEPVNPAINASTNPTSNGNVGLLAFLSGFAVGAFRTVIWRPIRFVLSTQPTPEPQQPTPEQEPHNATSATRVSPPDNGFKRRRVGRGSAYQQAGPSRQFPSSIPTSPYRSLGTRRTSYSRTLGRTVSRNDRYGISNGPQIHKPAIRVQQDPNFNYAGHFSLDALDDASDSEDDEYPGSPMDIDTPSPVALNQTEAISARQSIVPGHTQSHPGLDEHTPMTSNQTEAILARPPINAMNFEKTPKLDPAAAAARRAVKLFPKDSMVPKTRVGSSEGKVSGKMPVTENPALVASAVTRLRHKATVASTSAEIHVPRKSENQKARYDNVLEFFPNDIVHSLPGLGDEHLPADARKVELLKRELMERVRQEEIEAQNAALRGLGLRRPNSTLITAPSLEWVKRAIDAPHNGTFNPRAVHPDAVELKPRDFSKLVPQTAWLNDDCVHSTLCCLAAYINKKANVKPRINTPKCVAVSSLYWKAFCGDHTKLYPRPFGRKWNMTPNNFLDIDTVLIPVNSNAHWTLVVIRPSRRTVSYLDSFHQPNETQLRHAYQWLELFLGDKFVANDWETQEFASPQQTNAWDCGMFVITNAMCLALGVSPMCYNEDKMPIQRQRIAAMLLNGGFHGEFDLSHL